MEENIVKIIIDRMTQNLTTDEIAEFATIEYDGNLEFTKTQIKVFVEENFPDFEFEADEMSIYSIEGLTFALINRAKTARGDEIIDVFEGME